MDGGHGGAAGRPAGGGLSGHDVALYGVLAALALVFGYIEVLFPLPVPIPGIKLGLGNIVVLFALVAFGWRQCLAVMVVKVVASSLLFGNPAVLMYSLAGGVASCLAMCASSRLRCLSIAGVSMVGGVFHMFGQLAVVSAVLAWRVALAFAPVLIVSGLVTGFIIGYLCRLVIRTVGRSRFFKSRRKASRLERRRLAAAPPGPAE